MKLKGFRNCNQTVIARSPKGATKQSQGRWIASTSLGFLSRNDDRARGFFDALRSHFLLTCLVAALLCAMSMPVFSDILKEGWYAPEGGHVSLEESKSYLAAKKTVQPVSFLSEGGQIVALSSTTAGPEIQNLARALQHDPKLIYDYVHNNIEYTPYYGSMKGATLTLFEGSGNDFDQASLLISLLRESGYSAQFVIGTQTIPGDNLANWLGGLGDSVSNPRWKRIGCMLGWHGIPYEWVGGDGTARVARVWVKANIGGVDYVFDPALKAYSYFPEKMTASLFYSSTGHNTNSFLADATSGATIGTDYVKNLNETNVRNRLQSYTSAVINTIRTNFPNDDVRNVYGGRKVVETQLSAYQTSLPFPVTVDAVVNEIEAQYQTTLRFQFEGIDVTFNTADMADKRLTITFPASDFRPELRLDGTLIAQGNPTTQDTYYYITITTDHPFAYNNGTYFDQMSTSSVLSGNNTYTIVKAFGIVTDTEIKKRSDEVIKKINAGSAKTSEEVLGESLNVIGLSWMQENFRSPSLLAPSFDVSYYPMHSVGLVSQKQGYTIDISQSSVQVVNIGALDDTQVRGAFLESTWGIGSAFEHAVFEQLAGPGNPCVSTIKLLQTANQQGNKIFKANAANYSTILPQLQNYPSAALSTIQSRINAGYTLILHENGQLSIGGSWRGIGSPWLKTPGIGAGFWIYGGFYGGNSSSPGNIDPENVYKRIDINVPDRSRPWYLFLLGFFSVDPVNMTSGAFVFNHADLTLGKGEPLGLSLSRSYNSSDHFSKRNMGFGWAHDYDVRFNRTGHAQPGLGLRSPEDAASTMTALYIVYDVIYHRPTDELAYTTMALIFKWATDQLIENAVTVQFGSKSAEFVKQPDGTYTSPPGITTKLVDDGDGTLSLRERFGGRTDFDVNGRIERIQDIDGNETTFSYSGDKLSTVRDEFNRTLTFSYTGENLTSVSDSEGRSVIYGYDGNNDLASYTDPENKVWEYVYDGFHRLTSLKNPLLMTTAVNVYDSESRVQTQTVPRQGSGTATYNFYFSGFRNVEEDPFGRQMIYYIDDLGRTTRLEDELGHKTIITFDGQNHKTGITDPRNNTTAFTYNADQNMTKVKDALNEESIFRYDPQLRLDEVEDPLHHISYFDYDSEHHLNQFTNAENDDVVLTYYANGQVENVVDGRNVATTFLYDAFGLPESAHVALHPPIQFDFDPIGRAQELTDNENALTQFDYDNRNLPLKITDPLGKEVVFTYDNAGRLLTRKDRNNDTTSYTYTPLGKIDTVTYPNLSTAHFTYNLHDQLTDMTDSLGNTHFVRDDLYRVTSVTDPNGFTVSYQYDEAGNVTKITYPGNKDVIYTYDALNRLKTVTTWLGQTVTYIYDDAGRLTGFSNFNGITTSYDYDDANRLTFLQHKDMAANRTIARYTFILDGNGNRVTAKVIAPLEPAISTMNVPYAYNPKKNRLTNVGGTGLTYDDEGQLESMGGVNYDFDYEHRLVSAGSSNYAYDGSGNRLRATHGGVQTRYIYDLGGNLLAEADAANNIIAYYVHGLGLLAMITPGNQTFCYHYDGAGNTIAITDLSKTIRNTYAYTPFGTITENETFDQPFTFSGEYGVMQEPSGLYYMRARYYDPIIGRFISEDPIGFAGGDVNLFAYTGNNPINFVDPWGEARWGSRRLDNPKVPAWLNGRGAFRHDQIWYEDDTNSGFFDSDEIRPDRGHVRSEYNFVKDPRNYDDYKMKQAERNVQKWWDMDWRLQGNNCQDYVKAVINEYNRIEREQNQPARSSDGKK